MKKSVSMLGAAIVLSMLLNVSLASAQEPIYYHRNVFKISGTDFYINISYIFENPDPRVEENNTITYLIRPYNSTHLNITTIKVYYLYYYYYRPQVRRVESSGWWFMKYSPEGYIALEYNGSSIPTFNLSTYAGSCDLLDNSVSRVMLAQFSSDVIDVNVRYWGSVDSVNEMLCSNNPDDVSEALAVMGGSSDKLEIWYFVLAYAPLFLVLVSIYYFVKRKMPMRRLVKYRK